MPLILALALQAAPTLPAEEADAAQRCAAATISAAQTTLPDVETKARAMYFAIVATRARPTRGITFLDAMLDNTDKAMGDSRGIAPTDAAALLTTCSARFPLVDRMPVLLPTDRFQRNFTCMGGIALAAGIAAARDKVTGGNESAAFDASAQPFIASLRNSQLPSGDGMKKLMDDLVRSVADLGTPFAIAKTCAALNAS